MKRKPMTITLIVWFGACLSGSGLAQTSRPGGKAHRSAVAYVHLVDGKATVKTADGTVTPAVPGMPLVNSDEVTSPIGGFVVVRLRNDHLVRIDEEITLKVADIVLLNAPKAQKSFEKQLGHLLTKSERTRGERIAGWHARLGGAQTVPPQARPPKKFEKKASSKADFDTGATKRDDAAAGQKTSAVRRKVVKPSGTLRGPDKARESLEGALKRTGPVGSAQGAPEAPVPSVDMIDLKPKGAVKSLPETWRVRVAGKLTRRKAPLPPLAVKMLKDKNLLACLRVAVSGLPLTVERLRLMIKLEDHQVRKLVVGGGLRTPDCAKPLYKAQQMPEGPKNGWVILEVPL